MILYRILQRDLIRSRTTSAVVFSFIFLSSLLIAGGIQLIATINGAMTDLFETARVPEVVQMHAGDLDRDQIDTWAHAHPLVADHQVAEMISLDGESLYLGTSGRSEKRSVMDIGLVRQNDTFDFLLDEKNSIYRPQPGQIGLPVYYALRDNLVPGDPVTIRTPRGDRHFTVGAIVRDAQMNPAIIHSKRLVLHDHDFSTLRQTIPDREYLIEFILTDPEKTDTFMADYQASGLPQTGPMVDRNLFRTLNALSDGIVAAVLMVLSLLLIGIAILCLRFTILASLEEDYREIGVMKAIGMDHRHIRRIYTVKYAALGALASLLGYVFSFPLSAIPGENVTTFLGTPAVTPLRFVLPAAGALGVLLAVVLACLVILRRIHGITAVTALRGEGIGKTGGPRGAPGIGRFRTMNINVVLGLRDVLQRFRLYRLLTVIFVAATFTIIVPVHFLSTISSEDFVSYMGIGRSDIRIDLRQTDDRANRFDQVVSVLQTDSDVSRFAPLITSQFTVTRENGETETMAVETGNVSLFPPDFLEGTAPTRNEEIALSYLNAQDVDIQVGDTLILDGAPLTVSGIYQDVTNGGRTAKATFPHNPDEVLWYSLAVDLRDGVSVAAKRDAFAAQFAPARVTDLAGYMEQTLGTTVHRLRAVTAIAIVVGLGISVLITALFLNMLIRKDTTRIAILRSLGFTLANVRTQYLTTAMTILGGGVILGTLFSNTLGQRLVGFLWSFMGAARIRFVIEPLKAYLILPLLFATVVTITTRIAMSGINRTPGGIR
jgi:putative ABC transport system permease protein